jgi:hypothetical protein
VALSEQEEFELLSLERERAMRAAPAASQADVRAVDNAMPAYTAPQAQTPRSIAGELMVKGMPMGPLGVPMAATFAVSDQLDKWLQRGAYDAGGAVTDATGSPKAGFATNVGIQALPALLSGKLAGALAKPALESASTSLMQSAIKPAAADLLSKDADRAIKTMLNEGINVTPGGMAEIRKRVGTLSDEVSQIIKNSDKGVNTQKVADTVNRAFNKFRYAVVNRDANLASIQDARQQFVKAIDDLDPMGAEYGNIPVQLAQKIKQATQRLLADDFGGLSRAQLEAGKDLAFGLRKGIESAHPEVIAKNAKMEELLNALSVSEKHALQSMNKNPAGLSLLAENPKAAAAFMADRSAAFKSILARMLNAGKERVPEAVGASGVAVYEGVRNTPRD